MDAISTDYRANDTGQSSFHPFSWGSSLPSNTQTESPQPAQPSDTVNISPESQQGPQTEAAGNSNFVSAFMGNFQSPAPSAGRTEPAPVLTGADRPAPRTTQLPPRIDAPTQIVGRPANPNPDRRNVIVMDDFRTNDNIIPGTNPRSHGESISRPLETQGYNVYRVQSSEMDEKSKNTSGQSDIDHLADRIQRGEIPARPGDVVNMSFGPDKNYTFKDVNRLAGYTGDQRLTRDNLTPERAEALRKRFEERVNQPNNGLSAKEREELRGFIQTADGIDRLKSMGLVVVNAAGNEGPDSLHPGMLNATHMLQNRNGDGSFDPTSARHALTEPARGSFTTRIGRNGVDVNNDGIPDFERGPTGRGKVEDMSGTSFSVLEYLRRTYPPSSN